MMTFLSAMLPQAEFAILAGVIFTVGTAVTTNPSNNNAYLGSQPSKAYFFPWLVNIHREFNKHKEFFGSGSILTRNWVIGSMDSFVRRSSKDDQRPFYQELEFLTLYSGGIWGTPYVEDVNKAPSWLQKRRVSEIHMFSGPNAQGVVTFRVFSEPNNLNAFERSPFGFSMSICLIKVKNPYGQDKVAWEWKRGTLPIPLFDNQALPIKIRLGKVIEQLEKSPFSLECYIGGWRLGDYRLVQRKVVYVPFSQCENIYCGYDQRACLQWPVKGIHACFKSLTFDDLCWVDQGSALYCTKVSESAIAVLTSGPTCGHDGLPGVYTLVNHAMDLYDRVSPGIPYVPISKEEAKKYTPPPEKDLFPTYR